MSIIKLRTLTEKSTIPDGKYAGCKVGDLLKIAPDYLIYSYYHYSNISFHEDILKELNIERIPKPGKSPEKHIQHRKDLIHGMTNEQRMHYYSHKNRVMRAKVKHDSSWAAQRFNKSKLAWKNQGH